MTDTPSQPLSETAEDALSFVIEYCERASITSGLRQRAAFLRHIETEFMQLRARLEEARNFITSLESEVVDLRRKESRYMAAIRSLNDEISMEQSELASLSPSDTGAK